MIARKTGDGGAGRVKRKRWTKRTIARQGREGPERSNGQSTQSPEYRRKDVGPSDSRPPPVSSRSSPRFLSRTSRPSSEGVGVGSPPTPTPSFLLTHDMGTVSVTGEDDGRNWSTVVGTVSLVT